MIGALATNKKTHRGTLSIMTHPKRFGANNIFFFIFSLSQMGLGNYWSSLLFVGFMLFLRRRRRRLLCLFLPLLDIAQFSRVHVNCTPFISYHYCSEFSTFSTFYPDLFHNADKSLRYLSHSTAKRARERES